MTDARFGRGLKRWIAKYLAADGGLCQLRIVYVSKDRQRAGGQMRQRKRQKIAQASRTIKSGEVAAARRPESETPGQISTLFKISQDKFFDNSTTAVNVPEIAKDVSQDSIFVL